MADPLVDLYLTLAGKLADEERIEQRFLERWWRSRSITTGLVRRLRQIRGEMTVAQCAEVERKTHPRHLL